MTQTAAQLDALLSRPATTSLESDMHAAILALRIQLYGPIVQPPPTGTPPPGALELVWNPNGNTPRMFAHRVFAGDTRSFWFRTPASPTRKHVLNGGAAQGGFEDAPKDFTLRDLSGTVIKEQKNVSGLNFPFAVDTPVQWFTTLKGNTVYVLTVNVMSASRAADYYLDLNNS